MRNRILWFLWRVLIEKLSDGWSWNVSTADEVFEDCPEEFKDMLFDSFSFNVAAPDKRLKKFREWVKSA